VKNLQVLATRVGLVVERKSRRIFFDHDLADLEKPQLDNSEKKVVERFMGRRMQVIHAGDPM
jgi:chorismate-pyruvate lyase